MRRLTILLVLLLAAECVVAQNPKAVFKSLEGGDILTTTDKFEKINDKTREKMPSMCQLAEAALLNMPRQAGADKLRGYEILANSIQNIRSSADADKVFKGLNITLEQVIADIENSSCDYVVSLDEERSYVLYIDMARRGGHPRLEELEQRLEYRRYRCAIDGKSVEECDYFLALYSESKYLAEVESHRKALRFSEAVAASDEATMERFLADYPDHTNASRVAARLMQVRYERIFKSDDLDDMKWFVSLYPGHKNMDAMKQMMADLEFPILQSTCEALESFIAYYPKVSQLSEVRLRLQRAKIIEQGSIADFVNYVKSYGCDSIYSELLRHIYTHTKRYIITPDYSEVTLLHFANEQGLAGYMDLKGNVVIEPKYSCERVECGAGRYNAFMLSEFTQNRPVAVVKLNGNWGVIDTKGNAVVPHKYQLVTIYNNRIYAVADTSRSFTNEQDENCEDVGYYCDIYSFSGELLKSNEGAYLAGDAYMLHYRQFETNDGAVRGAYLTPKYAITRYNNHTRLLGRDGKEVSIGWESDEGITDNIVVINLNENGMTGRYYVDLDSFQAIKRCPWQRVYPMSCGRAMVFDGAKYGFINKDFELVIPCKYDITYSTTFNCGLMMVSEGGKTQLIDINGKVVSDNPGELYDLQAALSFDYNLPGIFIEGNKGKYRVFDASGHTLVELESAYRPVVIGNYVVDSNHKRYMFNLSSVM